MFGRDEKSHLHLRDLVLKAEGLFPDFSRVFERLNKSLGHLCLKGTDAEFHAALRQTFVFAKTDIEYRRPSGKIDWADSAQVLRTLLGLADDIADSQDLVRRGQAVVYVLITFAGVLNGAATPGESFLDFRLRDLSYRLPREALKATDNAAFGEVLSRMSEANAENLKRHGRNMFKWFPTVWEDAIYLAGEDGLKLPEGSGLTLDFCQHMRRELIAAAETMGDCFLALELVAILKQRVTDRLAKRDERRAAFAAALTVAFKAAGLPDGVPVEITYDSGFDAIDLSEAKMVQPHIMSNPIEPGSIGMFIRTAEPSEDAVGQMLGHVLEIELVGVGQRPDSTNN
ncbi:MAG: hypothetical protein HY975_01700 [Candidatus Kerfeldbacteria bacterium]|nr:hypothetical protein [Candidatus Kerfeldbacteria bacterium]